MKRILLVLPLLALITIFPAGMSAQQTNTTLSPTQNWEYQGFNVTQMATGDRFARFEQLPAANFVREKGVLPIAGLVAGTEGAPQGSQEWQLLIVDPETKQATVTDFYLPGEFRCYGCGTSGGQNDRPVVREADNRMIVKNDAGWYLFDPITMASEQILSPQDLPAGNYNDYTLNVLADDKIVAEENTPYVSSRGEDVPSYLLINATNASDVVLERVYDNPEEVEFIPNAVNHNLQTPDYLHPTGELAGGIVVGQIGTGIYAYNNDTLTKIGYSDRSLRGTYQAVSFTEKTALPFGNNTVGWIGEDDALYIAELTGTTPHTGALNIPTDAPFRTHSDSTVFFEPSSPSMAPLRVFETAGEYIERFDDPNFEKVLWIPDDAPGAENLPE
jgi:hypothetical protein